MTFLDNIEQIVAAWPILAFGAVFLAVYYFVGQLGH